MVYLPEWVILFTSVFVCVCVWRQRKKQNICGMAWSALTAVAAPPIRHTLLSGSILCCDSENDFILEGGGGGKSTVRNSPFPSTRAGTPYGNVSAQMKTSGGSPCSRERTWWERRACMCCSRGKRRRKKQPRREDSREHPASSRSVLDTAVSDSFGRTICTYGNPIQLFLFYRMLHDATPPPLQLVRESKKRTKDDIRAFALMLPAKRSRGHSDVVFFVLTTSCASSICLKPQERETNSNVYISQCASCRVIAAKSALRSRNNQDMTLAPPPTRPSWFSLILKWGPCWFSLSGIRRRIGCCFKVLRHTTELWRSGGWGIGSPPGKGIRGLVSDLCRRSIN